MPNVPWNKERPTGQKRPLKPKDVWAIRVRLQLSESAAAPPPTPGSGICIKSSTTPNSIGNVSGSQCLIFENAHHRIDRRVHGV
jgi:hypothetical protein